MAGRRKGIPPAVRAPPALQSRAAKAIAPPRARQHMPLILLIMRAGRRSEPVVVKAPDNAFGGACYCLGVDPAAFGPRRGRSALRSLPSRPKIDRNAGCTAFGSVVFQYIGARRGRSVNRTPTHPYPQSVPAGDSSFPRLPLLFHNQDDTHGHKPT